MPDRITEDPNRAKVPDHSSPAYAQLRHALVSNTRTEEQVIQMLDAAWEEQNNRLKEAWARQVEEDRQAEDLRRQQAEERRREEQQQQERPRTAKKTQLNPLAADLVVSASRMARPSAYAIKKLERFELVPLWYFTEEGCEHALRFYQGSAQDTFTLANDGDGTVSLQPINAAKASKYALPDEKLTWRQMMVGSSLLLQQMVETGWPNDAIQSLAGFFVALNDHPLRRQRRGDQVLLCYQADVRPEWTRALTCKDAAPVFNIAKINNKRLREIEDMIFREQRDSGLAPSYASQGASSRSPSPEEMGYTAKRQRGSWSSHSGSEYSADSDYSIDSDYSDYDRSPSPMPSPSKRRRRFS